MRLKALALVVGALVGGVGAASLAGDKGDKEGAKVLNGTWQVVSQWTNGKEDAIPRDGGDMVIIDEGKYTLKRDGKEIDRGTFTVDPTKTPKAIDNVMTVGEAKGKTVLGIYEQKGDELKVAWSRAGAEERPTGFTAKSYQMTTLKRVKP